MSGALPALPVQQINLYGKAEGSGEVHDTLVDLLRQAFSGAAHQRLRAV